MVSAPLLGGGPGERIELPAAVFEAPFHQTVVHNCVRAEQAARRQGTAATRTRGMVSGGGAKPWRQKGTGRARAGSIRSPLWRGGGTVFGPHPRTYVFKVNRKERRAALRAALSLHAGRGSLVVLKEGSVEEPRAARGAELLGGLLDAKPILVVVAARERKAALAFRNLAGVVVLPTADLGVSDLLRAATLVLCAEALSQLEERCAAVRRGRKEVRDGA